MKFEPAEPAAEGENAVNAVAQRNASLLTCSSQTDVQRFLTNTVNLLERVLVRRALPAGNNQP